MKTHFLTATRKFSAAHRLPNDPGKCSNLHGHTYTVRVKIATDQLDAQGMVMHFDKIKDVIDRFDHKTILDYNDPLRSVLPPSMVVIVSKPPTTEYLAYLIADTILTTLVGDSVGVTREYASVRVTLEETADLTSSCDLVYTRDRLVVEVRDDE